MQSGVPIAVSQATNNNLFAGFGMQRPNINGDPELPDDERSVSRWFNTSVFSTAPQFTLGNASRNPVRGPAYRNLDLALSRRVPLSAGTALESGPRPSTSPTRRRSARRTARSDRPRSARSRPRRIRA